jgi:uncharacterized tellurite resistance protein B-like protein
MGSFLGVLAILGLALLIWWRIRDARRAGDGPDASGTDVRLNVRRLMHGRSGEAHPADAVDDPRLAAAGVVVAVATMDGPISQAEIGRMKRAAQETFEISEREALDVLSFGRWIAGECATNGEAVRRLSRIVLRTAGPEAGPDLVRMIEEVATAGGTELGPDERDAIAIVRSAFGMEPARRRQG